MVPCRRTFPPRLVRTQLHLSTHPPTHLSINLGRVRRAAEDQLGEGAHRSCATARHTRLLGGALRRWVALQAKGEPPSRAAHSQRPRRRHWAAWRPKSPTVSHFITPSLQSTRLAAYTPEGVHLFRHDLRSGVSTNGKSTAVTGQQIKFDGPRREPDWRVALAVVLDRMAEKGCTRLAFVPWRVGGVRYIRGSRHKFIRGSRLR